MSYRKLADTIILDFTVHLPTTGAVSDADALPTVEIWEDATDTTLAGGTVTKRVNKTGNYRVAVVATTANGFEVGKSYNVVVTVVAGGVTAKAVIGSFVIDGKRLSDLQDLAAGAAMLITAGTGVGQLDVTSGVIKANMVQILASAITGTAAQIVAAFTKFFDKASPTGTVNSLPDAVAGAASGVAIVGSVMGKSPATLAAADVSGNLPGDVVNWKGSAAPAMTGDAFARLGAAGAGLTALGDTRIAALDVAVSTRAPEAAGNIAAIKADVEHGTYGLNALLTAIGTRMATFTYTAPDSAATIAAAVWNYLTASMITAGSIGKKLADWVVGTIDTYTGNTKQTGDVFANLPTNFVDLKITDTTGIVDAQVKGQDNIDFGALQKASITAAVPAAATIATSVWAAGTRTLTSFGTLVADIATAVWGAGTKVLTSFGTLVADIATAVWGAGTKALTDKAGFTIAGATTTLDDLATLIRGADSDTLKTLSDQIDLQALEATLTDIKGAGWTNETLSSIKGFVDDLEGRLTAARAGYLDNLSAGAVAQEGSLTAIKGVGWSTQTLVAISALVDDLEGRLTAARAGYLDELGAANIPADVDTLLSRITALRAGYLDELAAANLPAEVDGIKTVTEKLDTGLVVDGVVYQFTANALELAPAGTGGPGADPWLTVLPGAYGVGTAGQILGDNLDAKVSEGATPDLSALALEANVQGHAAAALTAYDPPTRTEAIADKDEVLAQVATRATLGSGPIVWSYTLTNSVSGLPIADADVWITTDLLGANILASGRTNQAGVVIFNLDAGQIYVWRQKSGYNFDPQPDLEEVTA